MRTKGQAYQISLKWLKKARKGDSPGDFTWLLSSHSDFNTIEYICMEMHMHTWRPRDDSWMIDIFSYIIYFLQIFKFIAENTTLHSFEMFSCHIALISLTVFVLFS